MGLYSVPSVVVFKRWGSKPTGDPQTRRLLIKNDGPTTTFRLTLPEHAAIHVSGGDVERASSGPLSCVELKSKASASLVVTLLPESASHSEIHQKLIVRTRREWLHVPLTALKDAESPIPPDAYTTAPEEREHWDDDSDDEADYVDGITGAARTGSGRKKRVPKLTADGDLRVTPAECTEAEELAFYKSLVKQDIAAESADNAAAEIEVAERAAAVRAAEDAERQAAAELLPKLEMVIVRGHSGMRPGEQVPLPPERRLGPQPLGAVTWSNPSSNPSAGVSVGGAAVGAACAGGALSQPRSAGGEWVVFGGGVPTS